MKQSGYRFGGIDLLMENSDNQRKSKSWTLIYIKGGIGMYKLEGSLRSLNQGDMLILPPMIDSRFDSESLGDEYNENMDALVLQFNESWLDELINVFPSMSTTVLKIREIKNPLSVIGPKWMKISSLLTDYISADALNRPLNVISILSQISTATDVYPIINFQPEEEFSIPQKIEMINRYISCNLRNKISLEDVSSYVRMSRTYFCMFFKNHFNEGFAEYINRKRIEKACQMLAATNKDIESIVAECGFKTVPYFTRVFSKIKGTTPGKYRVAHIIDK
jgi:YesN/AraC family two-component response regulator